MPGYCPAPLALPALRLWKTFRSKPNTIPVEGKKCSPSHRNAVRNHNGIVLAFRTESRSASTGFPTLLCKTKFLIVTMPDFVKQPDSREVKLMNQYHGLTLFSIVACSVEFS
jgi:hypothetical protein